LGGARRGALLRSRSGSQKRRTTERFKVNCTPEQFAALSKLADAHGQSLSALTLNTLLKVPLPRVRRPRVEDELMRRYFVETARTRDALKPIEAELGRSGNNLNQVVHAVNAAMNMGRPLDTIANIVKDALLSHRHTLQAVEEFIRDLRELRTAGMNAIGLELHHGSTDDE
jgi:hypothetical protein